MVKNIKKLIEKYSTSTLVDQDGTIEYVFSEESITEMINEIFSVAKKQSYKKGVDAGIGKREIAEYLGGKNESN